MFDGWFVVADELFLDFQSLQSIPTTIININNININNNIICVINFTIKIL